MHELSLAKALVDQVNSLAKKDKFSRVKSIKLSMGPLSGVERDSFEFCFPLAAQGTVLEGAKLVLQEDGFTLNCNSCNLTCQVVSQRFNCTHCDSSDVRISGGDEFLLKSMEVE